MSAPPVTPTPASGSSDLGSTCLAEDVIVGFVSGSLSPSRARHVEEHVDACADCRQILSALAGLSQAPVADDAPPSSDPAALLAGKYRVEGPLGQGGMGVVVRARHLHLDKIVAVKLLIPGGDGRAEAVRFLREARTAARLRSEHAARVLDAGVLADGRLYLAMELLEGRDLARVIREDGPQPPSVAIDYVLQACDALGEAHELGIVHRDVKPANLFLTRTRAGAPLVKVLDFGLSKAPSNEGAGSDSDGGLTKSAAILGSPTYMSPEQIRNPKTVDARTDVWSLGVVLYELLTATPPFRAGSMAALWAGILVEPPAPFAVAVPPELEAIVLACLEKDPAKRIASVPELASRLVACGLGAAPAAKAAPAERTDSVPPAPASQVASAGRAGWVLLAACALLGVAVIVAMRGSAPPPASPARAPSVASSSPASSVDTRPAETGPARASSSPVLSAAPRPSRTVVPAPRASVLPGAGALPGKEIDGRY